VSGVQEQVGDLAAARGCGNSDDVPDSAVEGICRVIAAQGHFPGRQNVIGEGLRPRGFDREAERADDAPAGLAARGGTRRVRRSA